MSAYDTNEGPASVRPSPTTAHSIPPTSSGSEASTSSGPVRPLLLCVLPSGLFLLSAVVYAWAMAFNTFNERTVLFPVLFLLAAGSGLAYHRWRWGPTDGWDDIGLNGAFLWRRGHKALGLVATAMNVTGLALFMWSLWRIFQN